MNVIELNNVNYVRPGMNYPLQDIKFTVKQGEIVHLRGIIGAGKSTIIDFILGIRKPDSGEVKVFGYPPGELKSRFLTGVVPQRLRSPIQNAQLGRLINLIESHYPGAQDKVKSLLEDFELKLSTDKTELAGGEERLLFFALAKAGSPKLLILDEPTTYLSTHAKEGEVSKLDRFWQELKKFVSEGNTVLLVCHDRTIGLNPTRTLSLEDGHLLDESSKNEESSSETVELELLDFKKLGISHWIDLLCQHIKFNLLQTFQTDQKYLWLTLIASSLWAICISFMANLGSSEGSSSLYTITNAYSFYLAMTAANTTGNIIAEERQNEILTRFLKILPLPPIIYLSAKVIACLVISSLFVLTMLITTLVCNLVSSSVVHSQSMELILGTIPYLFLGLALGTIPYLFLGLGLGYLFEKPKSIQIATLMCSLTLTIPVFARPILQAIEAAIHKKLDFVASIGDNIAAHSPIYHYIQLILCWGKAPEYDQHIWLHISWLIWFTFICLFISLWAYWGTLKKEAKA
jgi:ABC-2 type transport system ATP-binding protein